MLRKGRMMSRMNLEKRERSIYRSLMKNLRSVLVLNREEDYDLSLNINIKLS